MLCFVELQSVLHLSYLNCQYICCSQVVESFWLKMNHCNVLHWMQFLRMESPQSLPPALLPLCPLWIFLAAFMCCISLFHNIDLPVYYGACTNFVWIHISINKRYVCIVAVVCGDLAVGQYWRIVVLALYS